MLDSTAQYIARYEDIKRSYKFYDYYVVTTHNGLKGLIYPWGEICAYPVYEFCDDGFHSSAIHVKKDSHSGILRADGTLSLYPDGVVSVGQFCREISIYTDAEGKKGLVDFNMNIIYPAAFDDIHILDYDLRRVECNGLKGYINRGGKLVIPCIFDEAPCGFGNNSSEARVFLGVHEFKIGLNGFWVRNLDMKLEPKERYYMDEDLATVAAEVCSRLNELGLSVTVLAGMQIKEQVGL